MTALNTRYPYWPDYTDDEGDALTEWFDDICGDCIEGRCHWGGEQSRRSVAAVRQGRDYQHPTFGRCGCARHDASVAARPYRADEPKVTAMAWRAAKERGDMAVDHD